MNPSVSAARRFPPAHGFTLVEVLVALAIVAIALSAGLKATTAMSQNTERQSDQLLAVLCAENELIKWRLSTQMPATGDSVVECQQAGVSLQVTDTVRPTPNPNFLRFDTSVARDGIPVYQLSTVMGRD